MIFVTSLENRPDNPHLSFIGIIFLRRHFHKKRCLEANMFFILLLIFVLIPVVELNVLIEVASAIGSWTTVGLVLFTAVVGVSLVRSQGLSTLMTVQQKLARGEAPGQEIVEGMMLAAAGVLLLIPGFVTDFIGLILLTPFTRAPIAKFLYKRMQLRMVTHGGFKAGFGPGQGPFGQSGPFGGQNPFEQNGNTITVKVDMPKRHHWDSQGSELVIHMPSDIRMNFEGISSNVELENLHSNVTVKTVSGNIKATKLQEHIELSSVSGNIKTTSLAGKIILASVSGNIDDKNSQGRLELQAVSGQIKTTSKANEVIINNISGNTQLQLAKVDELRISTVSGDTHARLFLQENGVAKASNVSGEIELDFQNDIAADFRLKANAGGDLINKLTKQKAEEAKYGPSAKLYFQTGNASSSVSVNTVSGDIVVK